MGVGASLATASLVAAGCAGAGDYGAYLSRWVGAPSETLVADWGKPDWRDPAGDGSVAFHYVYDEPIVEIVGSADGDVSVYHCLTTFRAGPDGRVRSWSYSGNFCVVPPGG